ncbi:MAG: hypothetical protein HQL73_12980, partial [Magnetococcales bacterium]|nr:hypothetical protein [Magnetococcales bacterium]
MSANLDLGSTLHFDWWQRGGRWLAQSSLVLVLALFLWLTFFVWPSSDDYGFAHNYHSHSLVTCQTRVDNINMAVDFPCHRYYSFDHPIRPASFFELVLNEQLTFVGRYFTNPLAFAIQGILADLAGVFEFHRYYPLISLIMILLFHGSAWIFARQWGYTAAVWPASHVFWGCLGFLDLYLLHMPHLASSVYQVSQLLMHQLCLALSLLLLASLLHSHRAEGWKKNVMAVLAVVLMVAVMGASEIILFWNGAMMFALMLAATRLRHPRRRFYQGLFLLATVCGSMVVFSPGTLSRIGETTPYTTSLWHSLSASFATGIRYQATWILSPTLWALSLFFLP